MGRPRKSYYSRNRRAGVKSTLSKAPKNSNPGLTELQYSIQNENSPSGRRIVTIGSWLESLSLASEHGTTCQNANFFFAKELRTGLESQLDLKCSTCLWKKRIRTDTVEEEVSLPINDALVWGVNVGGSNFQAASEMLTVMDVPFPHHRFYLQQEQRVLKEFDLALFHEIVNNGKEEARLAREAGDTVIVNGVEYPCTSVYVDGGWSTRSYGHSCKSKGGVAVIIGARTKKLLHIGIKNMFCLVCKRAANLGLEPDEHVCFKNWDDAVSATSMETSIILEGFKLSIDTHCLVYNLLIADGDSSVYPSLVNAAIYPGVEIKKAECVNHVIKNLNKALIKLTIDTSLPLADRRLLNQKQRDRIVKSVRSAITHRSKHDADNHLLLRKDILNVPHHTYGQHDNCDAYFCKKPTEENLVLEFQKSILWKRMMSSVQKVAFLSSRLIHNLTSNIAESMMNRVAKHNLGKRINVIQRHGWHFKVTTAALSFSKGRAFYAEILELLRGRRPSRRWMRAKRSAEKKLSRVRKHDPIRKHRAFKKTTRNPVSDKHYGPNASTPDVDQDAMMVLRGNLLQNLTVNEDEREQIYRLTTDQADSARWLEERRNRITASVAGEIFSLKDSTSNNLLVRKVLYPRSLSHLEAIRHGTVHERQARQAYTLATGNQWEPSGLFISLEHGALAATPDALVGDDGLLEVKCPFAMIGFPPEEMPRIMKEGSYLEQNGPTLQLKTGHKYFKQVVMQIFVTGRSWCDFVVYSFRTNSRQHEDFQPFVQRIWRDDETTKVWEEMKAKLIKFFEEDVVPEIVNPRVTRGMPIRQPRYRADAMEHAQLKRNQNKEKREKKLKKAD